MQIPPITLTTSSMSSLTATAIKMRVRGTAVVKRPVGETLGICCEVCVCVEFNSWPGVQRVSARRA